MKFVLNLFLVGVVTVLVVLVPFVLFEESLSGLVDRVVISNEADLLILALGTLFLIVDVVLPIPSSIISAFLVGSQGWWLGAIAIWVGNATGAAAGYALGAYAGMPIISRLIGFEDAQRAERLVGRFGSWSVFIARGIPVLGEATTLLAGSLGLPWPAFAAAAALSSLFLSVIYASFAAMAVDSGANPAGAFLAAMLVPALVAIACRLTILMASRGHRATDQRGE